MSGLELPTVTATGAAWFTWESITPGECMTLVALALAAWGLWQMRTASTTRNRQLDAQTAALTQQGEALTQQGEALTQQGEALVALVRMLDERTAALTRGLETVIERTAPGRDGA